MNRAELALEACVLRAPPDGAGDIRFGTRNPAHWQESVLCGSSCLVAQQSLGCAVGDQIEVRRFVQRSAQRLSQGAPEIRGTSIIKACEYHGVGFTEVQCLAGRGGAGPYG